MLAASEEKLNNHIGFVLYDPQKKKTAFDYQGARYFTPASNTKIFTLYTGLKILGDSVPAFRYVSRNDSLIFWGTGDPSFLYKHVYADSGVYHFLQSVADTLYFSNANFHTSHYGSGWAWDDYNSYYSVERSPFPIYGNIVTAVTDHTLLKVYPEIFTDSFSIAEPLEKPRVDRRMESNNFIFNPGLTLAEVKEREIPFRVSQRLIADLLSDTLKKTVVPVQYPLPHGTKTCYGVQTDSLYKVLMQESDNFIAEQVLLLCANVLSDTLQPEIAIDYALKNFLHDLPDEPVWVDGSGLSRYNLFTPRSIVRLWEKILEETPRERLFPLLATGGRYGTIRNYFKGKDPFIYGKTGTLSNNHCLSGFLITRKERLLIFSFMNSNYAVPTSEVRRNMEKILTTIHERY